MTTLVLRIPALTASGNKLVNRRNRFAYKDQRTRWLRHVRDAWWRERSRLAATGIETRIWPFPPDGHVCVTIERFARCADALDKDNLYMGCKPVLDALKKEGFLRDDNAEWLTLHVKQRIWQECEDDPDMPRGPKGWTHITLELRARGGDDAWRHDDSR